MVPILFVNVLDDRPPVLLHLHCQIQRIVHATLQRLCLTIVRPNTSRLYRM